MAGEFKERCDTPLKSSMSCRQSNMENAIDNKGARCKIALMVIAISFSAMHLLVKAFQIDSLSILQILLSTNRHRVGEGLM